MKTKYLILRSNGANGYWSYMGVIRHDKAPISTLFNDRFLNTGVEAAVQFDSKEEALTFLSSLGLVNKFFKIEEVYIVD